MHIKYKLFENKFIINWENEGELVWRITRYIETN